VVQEAEWPEAEFIVGNPPFLGDKKMIAELGEGYTKTIRKVYKGRVPGGADLVMYWFEKARAQLEQGKSRQAGLVAGGYAAAAEDGSTDPFLARERRRSESTASRTDYQKA